MDFLQLCLRPAVSSLEEFFSNFWHKKPLHSKSAHRFEPHFRLGDLEFLWATAMRVDPSSLLFFQRGGAAVTVLRSAFFAFAHQVSVVVNKADRLSPAIIEICEKFQRHFPFVYCNVYSTPPGEQSVPMHSDDRDVFVLQVHGAKHWTVYGDPPVVLPYKNEEVGKKKTNRNAAGGGALSDEERERFTRTVAFEGLVEAGDVVYLPRGFVHFGRALPSAPSVHLTIAVQTSDWDVASVMQDGIESALAEAKQRSAGDGAAAAVSTPDFACRTVLPPSLLSSENENDEEFTVKFKAATELILQRILQNPQRAITSFHERLRAKSVERRTYFEEHVAAAGVRFFPLHVTNSLLQWSSAVRIVEVTEVRDPAKRIGSVQWSVVLAKMNDENSEERNPTMQVMVSSAVLEIMKVWSEHFVSCPAPVAEMSVLVGELVALCVAAFLLRNGCLVRVA